MKKFFTLVAVILFTASAFAQITLVHSFEGILHPAAESRGPEETSYLCTSNLDNNTISIYDSNFSLYKTVNIVAPSGYVFGGYSAAYYDIFVKNKVAFFVVFQKTSYEATNDYCKSMIIDEDGNVIIDLGNSSNSIPSFFYMKNSWYMLCAKLIWNDTNTALIRYSVIYSLPGRGEPADVSEVPAPHHNARKYLYKDQVLIDSNNKTYTLQGQEVK